jgi:hypothetical protein
MRYFLKDLYNVQLAKVTDVKKTFNDTNYYPYFDSDTTVKIEQEPNKTHFAILKNKGIHDSEFYIFSKKQIFKTASSSVKKEDIVISEFIYLGFNIPQNLEKTKLSRRQIIKIENEVNGENQN